MRTMLFAVSAAIFLFPSSVQAARAPAGVTQFCGDRVCGFIGGSIEIRQHHRHHYQHVHVARRHKPQRGANHSYGGMVTIPTAAGTVTVASSFAPKIKAFIADVVARGFKGQVHCYASGGHVAGSLHYRGEACDFAQRGWGKTVAPMYHVADLAARHGLRDGCTFRDCGHIDSGARLARAYKHTRYARRSHAPQYATALPPKF